jgi:hypothetical protein
MPDANKPARDLDWWVLVVAGITVSSCLIIVTVLLVGLVGSMLFGVRVVPALSSTVVTVQVTAAPRVITATPGAADLPLNWTLVMDDPFDDNVNQWDEETYTYQDHSIDRWIQDGSLQWQLTTDAESQDYERCSACDIVGDSYVSVDATIANLEGASGFAGVMPANATGPAIMLVWSTIRAKSPPCGLKRTADSGRFCNPGRRIPPSTRMG